ncbi:hypothetical protein ACEWY4_017196 [Coilia grayii]|uniref:PiggyBac transposable element-derived protein domain-containing protein n=1 Tax=Coilia grayii TaxID=363190 RepID=A0ABD1JG49_9TELE
MVIKTMANGQMYIAELVEEEELISEYSDDSSIDPDFESEATEDLEDFLDGIDRAVDILSSSSSEEDAEGGAGPAARWQGTDVEDVTPTQLIFQPARTPGPHLPAGKQYSPLELFQLFVTDAMLQTIVNNSNLHGERRNPVTFERLSLEDLYAFLAMLVFIGVVRTIHIEDYWRTDIFYNFPFPSSVMTQCKFRAIARTLRLSSPADDAENNRKKGSADHDPLGKIRPVYEQMRQACRAHFHPGQNISVDEIKVKAKRCIVPPRRDLEPMRWGSKLFVLVDSSTGYTWDIFTRRGGQGASGAVGRLGYQSVMSLVDAAVLGQGYRLFVDDFHTSPALFRELLAERSVGACGTIREQCAGYPRGRAGGLPRRHRCPRGTLRWIREGPLAFVQWRDARNVLLCSSLHPAHANHTVLRKVRTAEGQRRTLQPVTAPPSFSDWDRCMGAGLLCDAIVEHYHILHHTNNWYKSFFYHFLDVAIVNAFILHRELAKERQEAPLGQVAFRKVLLQQLKAAALSCRAPPAGGQHKPRFFTQDDSATQARPCVHCASKTMVSAPHAMSPCALR